MKSLFVVLIHLIASIAGLAYGLQTVKPYPATTTIAASTTTSFPLTGDKKAVSLTRPKWGVDNDGHPDEYWFDQRIHSLGNVGFSGALHAAVAPAFTKLIDWRAYGNVDIRRKVGARWNILEKGGFVSCPTWTNQLIRICVFVTPARGTS
jgi:hypothetical protein